MKLSPIKSKNNSGSAISEFLVSMLVFVPFLAAFTLIGKMSDVENAAQQGARYSAWERTVNPPEAKSNSDLNLETHARVIQQEAWIDTAEIKKEQAEDATNDRVLWGISVPDGEGDRQALVSFEKDGEASTAGSSESVGEFNDSLALITEGMSGLDREGLYRGKTEFAINEIAALGFKGNSTCGTGSLDSYLTCIERTNSILVDDWSSSSPGQVSERVQERMPFMLKPWEQIASVLDEVEDKIGKPAGYLTGYNPFADISDIGSAPGYVVPDIVPPSRLGNYDDENFSESLDK